MPDARCISCGYDLAGLAADALCPECALDVRKSIVGDAFAGADSEWRSRLRRGAAMLWWTIPALLLAFAVLMFGGFFALALLNKSAANAAVGLLSVLPIAATVAAPIALGVGLLMFTTQEPRVRDVEPRLAPRAQVRLFGALALLLLPATRWVAASATGRWSHAVVVVDAAFALALALFLRAFAKWLAALLRRSGRDGSGQASRADHAARWCMVAGVLAVAALVLQSPALSGILITGGLTLSGISKLAWGLTVLVSLVSVLGIAKAFLAVRRQLA